MGVMQTTRALLRFLPRRSEIPFPLLREHYGEGDERTT
jgi:hypothetical protein